MSVKLVMFNTQGHRRAFRLSGAQTVIGRGPDCGLCIPLSDVSRRHCLLTVLDNEVRLKDLGSTNGTYVNSKRISEAILQPGDRITIGPIILTLQVNGVPTEGTRPESVPAGDSDDTVLADIEAAIALGPRPASRGILQDKSVHLIF